MEFLIHHMLWNSAARRPEKEALAHRNQRLSFSDVAQRTGSLALGLRECGMKRGDRIGIYLEASVPQSLSIFAVSQAGGVFVPINALLLPDQVLHIARDCGMTALITSANRLTSLEKVLSEMPQLKSVVVTSDEACPPIALPLHRFDDLSDIPVPSKWNDWNIERDLAALIYTSGSTGRPKGVMLNHAQIIAGSSIVSDYLAINENDIILAVLPFSFDAGLNQLMTAIQQRSTTVLINFTFAQEIVQTLVKEKITGLAGVPTLWSLMVQPRTAMEKYQFPHLRYITSTGGVMPQTVLASLRRMLPSTAIVLMYGLTEAFRSTYLPPDQLDKRPTSMGKAIPNTEILVVNAKGEPCKPGEVGELVHRGPTVSMGYWGQSELTAQRLRKHPFLPRDYGEQEDVCYSGDLVTMDEEGYLYFVGRQDTMIKSSGYRISPTEVEEVLMASQWLKVSAVIGVPDETLGQSIKAFVVPREGIDLDINALLDFCTKRLPPYAIPKQVACLSYLPQTTSGKVDYAALRKREGV